MAMAALLLVGMAAPALAEIPGIITYQGSLSVNGVSYTGTAYLKFAFADVTGTTNIWIQNNTPPEQPGNSITTSVNKGLFTVNLGDTNVPNMVTPIPSLASVNIPAYLKIWVSTNNTDFQLLTPFTRLTAAPFALDAQNAQTVANGSITAVKLAPGAISGTASLSLTGSTLQLNDAGGSASVNLSSITSTNSWKLDGNNVSSGQFIGSTNNQALEFRVNGERSLTLEPLQSKTSGSGSLANTYWGKNVIAGDTNNAVDANTVGAVIAGGGGIAQFTAFGVPEIHSNAVTGFFGTVGGGLGNSATRYGTVSGGIDNTNSGLGGVIAGGENNAVTGSCGTVAGGQMNVAGANAFAAGTHAKANHYGSFVWADRTSEDFASTAPQQFLIRAE
ncbi:MAG: hypothetical protein JWM68_2188, partial [Verrucomicrobiales bacterium]|nr:hypothetical protein [Verrucomicrobiales bacterium]